MLGARTRAVSAETLMLGGLPLPRPRRPRPGRTAPAVHSPPSPTACRLVPAPCLRRHSGRGLRTSRIRSPAHRLTIVSVNTPDTTIEGHANIRSSSAEDLPDYAPIPRPALGPALNEQGYYAGRVEQNLYWVTDGTY